MTELKDHDSLSVLSATKKIYATTKSYTPEI